MTKAQAQAEAKRRWGKNAVARDLGRAVTKEKYEAARQVWRAHRDREAATPPAERAAWVRESKRLAALIPRARFRVGQVMVLAGLAVGVMIEGEGWSWEEAFADADARKQKLLGRKG